MVRLYFGALFRLEAGFDDASIAEVADGKTRASPAQCVVSDPSFTLGKWQTQSAMFIMNKEPAEVPPATVHQTLAIRENPVGLTKKELVMSKENVVVAIFNSHAKAEDAVRTLGRSGLSMDQLTIVGKGYHTDEKVIGFYNIGDRIKLWGSNGAFWGGMWGLFAGGLLMTVPLIGPVVVLGHLAAMLVGAVEGALLAGGVSALAGALASLGIPTDSVVRYEEAVKADQYVVMAHGSVTEIDNAKRILQAAAPVELTVHEGTSAGSVGHAAHHHQSEMMAV